jgi:hypothetical protein
VVLLDSGPRDTLQGGAEPGGAGVARRSRLRRSHGRSAEIVDYEHRRKMLHIGSTTSVRYLDELKENIAYAPLTTGVMLRAAR